MEWSIPAQLQEFIARLDAFIDAEITPLELEHPEFFDHRKEYFRTDWENDGIGSRAFNELLGEARRRADAAGFFRYPLPPELGGQGGSNFDMAVIREHLGHRGPGLHNELTHEASVVANLPLALVLNEWGTPEQKDTYLEGLITGEMEMAFALTEPDHGSDATWLETTAVRDGSDWVINGRKRWNSGVDVAPINLVFARTSGQPGQSTGITAFLVPTNAPGFTIEAFDWTWVMPTHHARCRFDDVRVPGSTILGVEGKGLSLAQIFVHQNRLRQAAAGVGAAQFCVDASVRYAKERIVFGQPLSSQQGIQWQLAELVTETELVRSLVRAVAWEMDRRDHMEITDKVAMANLRGNRLACEAADRAIQVHGGVGYSRHLPFTYIYGHHRRYRITEGTEEIQLRRIAGRLFGYTSSPRAVPAGAPAGD
jgi:alkylation response protein AidB-like acyl-CoA dehydrogenase